MKKLKMINKKDITKLLDELAKNYRLLAPVEKDGIVNFTEVQNGQDITLDFYNSKEPLKKLFFPQSETLYCYSKEQGRTVPEEQDKRRKIVFGLRPCDAKAAVLLDNVFDGADFKDPYYLEKRENTIICSLACNEPQTSCFCTSLGLGPGDKDGSDIFIVDIGDKYLFEAVTQKGQKLLDEMTGTYEPEDKDIKKAQTLITESENKIKKQIETACLSEKLDELADSPIWDELAEKCIGCGICTYLCPTCHCFAIVDEASDCKGCRVRNWDSCMFGNFTLEASGHNPRPTGKERMRQRIMHKFNYFVKNFDANACVGCGRCFRNCPVHNDLIKVIEKINNAKSEPKK